MISINQVRIKEDEISFYEPKQEILIIDGLEVPSYSIKIYLKTNKKINIPYLNKKDLRDKCLTNLDIFMGLKPCCN